MRREAMKIKMILKKGMVFLFAAAMAVTGVFSLGVMAASGLEGAYISPKSKMGLKYANNFSRDVSKSQIDVPNFMADSDSNGDEPNKSFNAQQVAAGNSDAGQKWHGFAAYAKNHDPSDFWVKYKNVTTANGKSVDLKIEVTDWKTQNNESKPLPSNTDMFGHDNNSAHLGYAIGFSYKKTGVVMFSGFKWVKFKYTFLYNGTNTKAPFTGFATFQDIDQNQYVAITDGTECISKASYIGGSDGNTWCEPDGWTYKSIKDQNASSGMGRDTFDKTCISLYVNNMTDMSIKYGWTGHTAIAYFDLAPWAMNSFEDDANPDIPKKLIQSGSSWISNEKTSAVAYKLGDTYSYRYEDTTPTYATDILSNLWTEQKKTAISSYAWEDTLDSGLSYVAGSLQVDVGGKNFTSLFTDYSRGQNIKFSATSDVLNDTSFYGKKVTVTFKVKIRDAASYSWLGHERTADNKYRLIPNAAKRSMTYLKKLAYDEKKEVYTVTDSDYGSASQNTSTVWSKVPIGDPDNPDPDPKKTVSDEDEKNVLSNTLTNADETFTYTVSKEIEKNMPSTAKYSKVVIKDAVDSCLTIDSVKFYAGDKDVTSSFAPTSANKGNYLEYDALEQKLIEKGVLEEEIAFIHDANTDRQKAVLFSKVRSGQIRFLFGSTSKMGAGTNVQDRLIALHHLDVPWRPADIEQQEGRILRQGNKNKKVKIFRYIVENTFDAYMWQILENKQKFISQIMTSKSPVRSCQDVDAVALSYAETKALATGNPKIKEKMELDVRVTKLKMLKANYESNLFRLQDAIAVEYPQRIAKYEELTAAYEADIAHLDTVLSRPFSIEIQDINYNDEKAAGEALVQACTNMKKEHTDAANIGTFKGFKMKASYSLFDNSFYVKLTRESSVSVEIKKDPVKNIERILTALKKMPGQKAVAEERLEDARQQFAQAKEEVQKPFDKEDELKYVQNRLTKINAELDMEPKTEPKLVKKEELKKCL